MSRRCVRTQSIRAALFVLAPATVAVAPVATFRALTSSPWVIVGAIAGALVVAGARHRIGARWPRALASVAFATWMVGTIFEHRDSPGRGLAVLLGAVGFAAFVWPAERLRHFDADTRADSADLALLVASAVAALFGLDDWLLSPAPGIVESAALAAAYAVPITVALRRRTFAGGWPRAQLLAAAGFGALPLVDVVVAAFGRHPALTPVGLFSPLIMFAVVGRRAALRRLTSGAASAEPGLLDAVMMHPSRVLVISFLGICAVGTLVLGLPVSAASGTALAWLDAAFTAVSATCVTGLVVVDTPVAFGGFGQLVVLVLIQVGGLGIMVFSAAAIVFLGKRLSLSHERAAVDLIGAAGRGGLKRALRMVLIVTIATEAAAALLMVPCFLARGDHLGAALWRGVFTAISAFCNAGFALQSDSLVPYADSPYLLAVVSLTVIIGGLGPAVVAALLSWRDPARRSLHARLVIWTTAILLVVPAGFIAALEWNGTLAGMSLVDKLFNAGFQSVTLRTAGFNSIDLAAVQPATWTLMILTMFVGGSPGSTAGGVKTTTIAVVVLACVAVIRGRERVEIFGRTLSAGTVLRATAVTTLGVLGCCGALVAIQLTQVIPLDVALFETVSALATVGVTTGGTAALDEVGKVLIMACMFAGRVGPLTLFVFLASNTREHLTRRPEEPVPIG